MKSFLARFKKKKPDEETPPPEPSKDEKDGEVPPTPPADASSVPNTGRKGVLVSSRSARSADGSSARRARFKQEEEKPDSKAKRKQRLRDAASSDDPNMDNDDISELDPDFDDVDDEAEMKYSEARKLQEDEDQLRAERLQKVKEQQQMQMNSYKYRMYEKIAKLNAAREDAARDSAPVEQMQNLEYFEENCEFTYTNCFVGDSVQQRRASAQLLAASFNIRIQELMAKSRGFDALLSLLRSTDLEVQRNSTLAVSNLALQSDDVRVRMSKSDAILTLFDRTMSNDTAIKSNSILAISNLCYTPSIAEKMVLDFNVLPQMIALLKFRHDEIQEKAARVISFFCNTDEMRTILAKAGIIGLLSNLLTSSNAAIHVEACRALANMAASPNFADDVAREVDGELLARVLAGNNIAAQTQAARAIANMLAIQEYKIVVMKYAMNPLLDLVAFGTKDTQLEALIALSNLSTYEPISVPEDLDKQLIEEDHFRLDLGSLLHDMAETVSGVPDFEIFMHCTESYAKPEYLDMMGFEPFVAPLDLQMIFERCERGYYSTVSSFREDIGVIVDTVRDLDLLSDPFGLMKRAEQLENLVDSLISQFQQNNQDFVKVIESYNERLSMRETIMKIRQQIVDEGGIYLVNTILYPMEELKYHALRCLANLSVVEANQIAIVANCEISIIISCLKSPSDRVVSEASRVLGNLANQVVNRPKLVAAGAIPALIETGRSEDKSVQKWVGRALAIFADSEDAQELMGQTGAIERLVNLTFFGEVDVRTEAAKALASLAENSNNKDRIMSRGALSAVLLAINTDIPAHQMHAARTVSWLAHNTNDIYRNRILSEGVLDRNLLLINKYLGQVPRHSFDCRHCEVPFDNLRFQLLALSNLSESPLVKERIIELDGLDSLVQLTRESKDIWTLRYAITALGSLAYSDRIRALIAETGIIPYLIRHCSHEDFEIQYLSAAALANLALLDANKPLVAIGEVAVLSLLDNHDNSTAQSEACRCLAILSVKEDLRNSLVALGCIDRLLPLLSNPDDALQMNAALFVSKLALTEDYRIEICMSDTALFDLVELAASSLAYVHREASQALANLAINNQAKTLIVDAGALAPLVFLLTADDMEAKRSSVVCISRLAEDEENRTIIADEQALRPLTNLIKTDDLDLLEKDLLALLNVTRNNTQNQYDIFQDGALDFLLKHITSSIDFIRTLAYDLIGRIIENEVIVKHLIDSKHFGPLIALAKSPNMYARKNASTLYTQIVDVRLNQAPFIEQEGLRACVHLLDNDDLIVRNNCIQVIAILAADTAFHPKIAEAEGIKNIIRMLSDPLTKNSVTRRYSLEVLAKFADNAGQRKLMVECDVYRVAMTIMLNTDANEVRAQSFRILANMAVDEEEKKRIPLACGKTLMREALRILLREHDMHKPKSKKKSRLIIKFKNHPIELWRVIELGQKMREEEEKKAKEFAEQAKKNKAALLLGNGKKGLSLAKRALIAAAKEEADKKAAEEIERARAEAEAAAAAKPRVRRGVRPKADDDDIFSDDFDDPPSADNSNNSNNNNNSNNSNSNNNEDAAAAGASPDAAVAQSGGGGGKIDLSAMMGGMMANVLNQNRRNHTWLSWEVVRLFTNLMQGNDDNKDVLPEFKFTNPTEQQDETLCTLLVNLLQTKSTAVLWQVLSALALMTERDKNRVHIHNASGVLTILGFLNHDQGSVRHMAARTIANIGDNEMLRIFLFENNAVVPLFKQAASRDIEIILESIRALSNFSRTALVREGMTELGVVPLLTKALRMKKVSIQVAALRALASMAISTEVQNILVELRAVPTLCNMLSSPDSSYHREVARLIACLCIDPDNCKVVVQHGGLERIVPFTLAEDMETQTEASRAMYYLCASAENQQRIVREKFLRTLTRAARDPDLPVQYWIVRALARMAENEVYKRSIVAEGSWSLLIHLLRSIYAEVRSFAVTLIITVLKTDEHRTLLASQGAVEALTELTSDTDAQLRIDALVAMHMISECKKTLMHFAKADKCAPRLIEMLREYAEKAASSSIDGAIHAAGCLGYIAANDTVQEQLVSSSAGPVLIANIRRNVPLLTQGCCRTLCNITDYDGVQRDFLTGNLTSTLIQCGTSDDELTSKTAVIAMAYLSFNDAFKRIIMEEGGPKPLMHAILSEDTELCAYACGCVANIGEAFDLSYRLAKPHFFRPLIECLKREDLSILTHATRALANLSASVESEDDTILKLNGVEWILKHITCEDIAVVGNTCRALANITNTNETINYEVVRCRGIPQLMAIIHAKDTDEEVLTSVANVFANLSQYDNIRELILKEGGLNMMLFLLPRVKTVPAMRLVFRTLAQMGEDSGLLHEIYERVGVTPFISNIGGNKDLVVQHHASQTIALMALSGSQEYCKAIVDMDGVIILLALSKISNILILFEVCKALAGLCHHHAESREIFVDRHGIKTALRLLEHKREYIQLEALRMLHHVALGPSHLCTILLRHEQVIEQLLAFFSTDHIDASVDYEIAACFANAAQHDDACELMVNAPKFIDIVFDRSVKTPVKAQTECTRLLYNLTKSNRVDRKVVKAGVAKVLMKLKPVTEGDAKMWTLRAIDNLDIKDDSIPSLSSLDGTGLVAGPAGHKRVVRITTHDKFERRRNHGGDAFKVMIALADDYSSIKNPPPSATSPLSSSTNDNEPSDKQHQDENPAPPTPATPVAAVPLTPRTLQRQHSLQPIAVASPRSLKPISTPTGHPEPLPRTPSRNGSLPPTPGTAGSFSSMRSGLSSSQSFIALDSPSSSAAAAGRASHNPNKQPKNAWGSFKAAPAMDIKKQLETGTFAPFFAPAAAIFNDVRNYDANEDPVINEFLAKYSRNYRPPSSALEDLPAATIPSPSLPPILEAPAQAQAQQAAPVAKSLEGTALAGASRGLKSGIQFISSGAQEDDSAEDALIQQHLAAQKAVEAAAQAKQELEREQRRQDYVRMLSILEGPGLKISSQVTDNQDGTYDVEYEATCAGRYAMTIQLGDEDLPGCPFFFTVFADEESPTTCVVQGEALRYAVAGRNHTFTIEARDRHNNHAHRGDGALTARLVLSEVTLRRTNQLEKALGWRPDYDKELARDFYGVLNNSPTKSSAEKEGVAIEEEIPPSPASAERIRKEKERQKDLEHQPVDYAAVPPNADVTSLNLYGFDPIKNRKDVQVLKKLDRLIVLKWTGRPVTVDATVKDNGDGTYQLTYRPLVSGTYRLHVLLRGTDVIRSPYRLVVDSAEPSPAHSYFDFPFGPGESRGGLGLGAHGGEGPTTPQDPHQMRAGGDLQCRILARDEFRNDIIIGGQDFRGSLLHRTAGLTVDFVITDIGNGLYDAFLPPRRVGEYAIFAYCNGKPTANSPQYLKLIEAVPHIPCFTAHGTGFNRCRVAVTTRFTLQARDKFGNPLSDAHSFPFLVEILSAETPDRKLMCMGDVSDNGDGTYTVTYQVATFGKFKISVTSMGIPIMGSPFSMFCTMN